jgi:hypothetical protein
MSRSVSKGIFSSLLRILLFESFFGRVGIEITLPFSAMEGRYVCGSVRSPMTLKSQVGKALFEVTIKTNELVFAGRRVA